MARQPNIIRPIHFHTTLPEDVWLKMTAYLYSEVEGRVPKGAYNKFLSELINDFFKQAKERADAKS